MSLCEVMCNHAEHGGAAPQRADPAAPHEHRSSSRASRVGRREKRRGVRRGEVGERARALYVRKYWYYYDYGLITMASRPGPTPM